MMNTPIKVSIGIPVYNAEKYIERCVISILEQDYASIEVIFVDDASKDRSVDIIKQTLESFISRKESVRIIHHKTNQGVSVARNTFLDNQTGDFVMFVDADDYLMPGAISKLVVKQQEDNSDLVSGNFVMDCGNRKIHSGEVNSDSTPEALLYRCCATSGGHNNVARLFRATLLNNPDVRFRPEIKIGEDWVFMVEAVLRMHSISYVDDLVYVYDYTNQDSAMHKISGTCQLAKWKLADVEVLREICLLVAEKDEKYNRRAKMQMANRLNDGFLLSAACRDKKTFRSLIGYLDEVASIKLKKDNLMFKLTFYRPIAYYVYLIYLFANRIKSSVFKSQNNH